MRVLGYLAGGLLVSLLLIALIGVVGYGVVKGTAAWRLRAATAARGRARWRLHEYDDPTMRRHVELLLTAQVWGDEQIYETYPVDSVLITHGNSYVDVLSEAQALMGRWNNALEGQE